MSKIWVLSSLPSVITFVIISGSRVESLFLTLTSLFSISRFAFNVTKSSPFLDLTKWIFLPNSAGSVCSFMTLVASW